MSWGLPPDWSVEGHHIDRLIGWVHWLMVLLAVFWLAYLLVTLWRFRAGSRAPRSGRPVRAAWALWVAGGVFLFEVVLMVFVEIPLWADRREVPPEDESFVVRVLSEQFAWNFHYPGEDGVFGRTDPELIDGFNPVGLDLDDEAAMDDLVTINQLHVPEGRRVLLWLGSKDVIHNFYLPHFRVKQDVLPGRLTPVWFTPTRTGTSDIGCAQLCGLGHHRMRGLITVEEEDAFMAWYEDEMAYM